MPLFCFNSKMVRLIVATSQIVSSFRLFQFQNGSINSEWDTAHLIEQSMFQFQNGSINSREDTFYIGEYRWFQFQNGSINRLFNDTSNTLPMSFNSKMVRLIDLVFIEKIVFVLFQFQNGSINRDFSKNSCNRIAVSIPKWFD